MINAQPSKNDIVCEMAYAIERRRVHSAKYWTAEQFQIWCHRDTVGKRSFREAKSLALAAYKSLNKLGVVQRNCLTSNQIPV